MATAEGPPNGKQISLQSQALRAKRWATMKKMKKKKKKQINILALLPTRRAQLATCAESVFTANLAFRFLSGQRDLLRCCQSAPSCCTFCQTSNNHFFSPFLFCSNRRKNFLGRSQEVSLHLKWGSCTMNLVRGWRRWGEKWSVKVKGCKIRTGKKSLTLDVRAWVEPVWACLYVRSSFFFFLFFLPPSLLFKWLLVHPAAASPPSH